jgi:short-chain fatty acids transporter
MSTVTRFRQLMERRIPDPLTFAVWLTLCMIGLALVLTPVSPEELLLQWGDGLSALLAFTMQMVLIITTAYVLAHTSLVRGLLIKLAKTPRSPPQAYILVILTGAVFSLISWPVGPIAAALVAREIARGSVGNGLAIHYPLLAAGGFGGFVVWEMGYSSSIALAVATEGNPTFSVINRLIPIQDTLLTWWNILTIATTLIAVVATVLLCHRRMQLTAPVIPEDLLTPLATGDNEEPAMAIKSAEESSRWLSLLTGTLVLSFVGLWFYREGISLQLNIVNWTFLGLGLMLVSSLPHYSQLFADGARVASPTLLQYPLYAGIMGIALQSGLAEQFTGLLISVANEQALPLLAFWSAGLINIFIPSGGAQWALQGPSFLEAAKLMEVDLGLITMSVAYGDQWTNLIQPFTAIPLLALTGLRLKHIYGFTLLLTLTTSVPLMLGLILGNA